MIWSNFGLQDKVPILSCHEGCQDKLTHPDYHPFLGWTMYNTTHQILLVWTYARKQHRWNEGEIFRINTMYYRSDIIVEPWTISIPEKVNPHYSVIKKCEIRGVYTIKRRNHIFVLMKYYFFVEIYEIIVKSIENSLTFPNYILLSRIRYIPYPTDSISHLFPLWGRFFLSTYNKNIFVYQAARVFSNSNVNARCVRIKRRVCSICVFTRMRRRLTLTFYVRQYQYRHIKAGYTVFWWFNTFTISKIYP